MDACLGLSLQGTEEETVEEEEGGNQGGGEMTATGGMIVTEERIATTEGISEEGTCFPNFTTICNEDGQEAGVTEEEVEEEEAMIGTAEGMTPLEDVMIVMTDMAGVLEVVPALSVARTITGKETALRDTEKVSVHYTNHLGF